DDVVTAGDERTAFDVADPRVVHDAMAGARADVVYHLAARSHVGESWTDPDAVLRVNVEGTRNMLDAARATGVARVLFVGSAEEYGPVPEGARVAEDAPLHPTTPYGHSKAQASALCELAWKEHGLETVCTRTFSHTGPGQSDRFLIPALARRIVDAERANADHIVMGSLEPVRDISDVRDVVVAYRLLAERGSAGEVYNVCSGEGVSVRAIADALLANARVPLRVEVDPALVRPIDVPRLVGDPSKVIAATGWQPRYSLEDTLDSVLAEARGVDGK
ncbi:MAG TPA: GDP-mannose 4,6-dehydratase, partial [Acidimicrobiia bacterium]|nr:GDP-mannose 4,6-dehydratase [Acidimicrobiia bacterium]